MQKKFLTNLALLLFLNLLVKPVWVLGIDRSVQNIVGEESYGFYFAILNFSFLFNMLLDLGITNFNNRNIAQNQHLLNKHFSGILVMKLLLGGLYLVFTFGIAFFIKYGPEQLYLLAWVCFNQFLLSFITYLRSNISGLLLFRTDSLMSVLDRLLMIIFCGYLIWGRGDGASPFDIKWFVYAQTLAYSITAIIAFMVVVKKSRFRKLNWNWPFFVMIIKQSFPFAILVFLMVTYYRSDAILLERLLKNDLGEQQAGVYAKAFRLLDAANMIPFLFAALLFPLYSRMIKTGESVVQLVKLSFSLVITLAVITVLGSYFYGFEIMDLLYHENIPEATAVYTKIMFSFIAISSVYIFGALLTANGNLKELNIISLIALIINFTLNFILIPKMQAVGSAYANLATQFAAAIPQVILALLVFKFRVNYRFVASLILFVIGVAAFNYFSRFLPMIWYVNFMVMVLASIVLASLLRLFNIQSLIAILKDR
jgi:O-antigen/teichoic acid export membrane protein